MLVHESNAAYHASKPLSKTCLWRIIEKNPRYFHHCETNPPPRTPAMLLGSVFHKLVLEPSDFGREFAVMPSIDRRTSEGKAAWSAFTEANAGREIVPADVYAQANEMAKAVLSNKLATYLCGGEAEVSCYFEDEITGLACKARPDSFRELRGRGLIVDLKSCTSAKTEDFMRDALRFGYDMQAALYRYGCERVRGMDCDFVFIAVEKEPPHLVNVVQAQPAFLTRGYDLMREALGTVKHCRETGVWYDYNGENDVIGELNLPKWLAEQYE